MSIDRVQERGIYGKTKKLLTNFLTAFLTFSSQHKVALFLYAAICALLIPISWQQDVYDWYYVVGRLFLEGKNVYEPLNINAIVKRGDSGMWGYPPLFLPFFSLTYFVSALTTTPFHLVLKVSLAVIGVLVAMQMEEISGKSAVVPLYLFNPVAIIGTIVQGFPEVILVYLLLLSLRNLDNIQSAAHVGLAALGKQTIWPMVPFFLASNLTKKWLIVFFGFTFAGTIPFLLLNYPLFIQASVLQHLSRTGTQAWEFLLGTANVGGAFDEALNLLLIAAQVASVSLLAFLVRRKILRLRAHKPSIAKYIEYFLAYEILCLTILFLIVPQQPHFLLYVLFPTILLMAKYPEFKYPYALTTIIGYTMFTLDQGLRHSVFHYEVWEVAYLSYAQLEPVILVSGALGSIVFYLCYFYAFYKIWRTGKNV